MERVLVCVTRQNSCERLIHTGARFIAEMGGELSVVHVAPKGATFLGNASDADALEYLFGVAKQYGADITVLRADDVGRALIRHGRNRRITHIILGISPFAAEGDTNRIALELERQLKGVQVVVVPA